jgi:hypothetical protein
MMARFKPVLVEVDYDPENVLEPLFKKVRELMDMEEPPDGNEGCKDCILLAAFHDIASVTDGVRPPRRNDQDDINRYSSEVFLVRYGLSDERQARLDALAKDAEPGGVLDLWLRDE